jgi:hypothetical protein
MFILHTITTAGLAWGSFEGALVIQVHFCSSIDVPCVCVFEKEQVFFCEPHFQSASGLAYFC